MARLYEESGIDCRPHHVLVRRAAGEFQLTFHCTMAAGTPITAAHTFTERVEGHLRKKVPNLGRVVIHVEPINGTGD